MSPKERRMIERVKTELEFAFSMVDIRPISFYLGLKVEQNQQEKTIKLSEPAYIDKVLAKFHLDKAHSINIPMKKATLFEQRTDREASPSEKEQYQRMTKSLMFSMVETRPDIAFAISIASHFAKNLSHKYTEAVKTILRSIKCLKQQGINYRGQDKLIVKGYSDSDWDGDKESQKSTSGFIFMLNSGPVSWYSKRQPTVALSSTKAE